MTPKSYPSHPPLPSLRLAAAADITRMADLIVLGFKDSEIFRYERPRYQEFPQDAVASFANLYRAQLLDSRSVVVVAEDWQRPDEASHFPFPSSENDSSDRTDAPAKRVVVGVACWILPEGSPRTGQFVVPNVGGPEPAPDRDLCQRRVDIFTSVKEAEEKT